MPPHTFEVDFEADEEGPEPELRERLAVCAVRHLAQADGYPQAGGEFGVDDAMEGKFAWEMTDAEFEATPPVRFDMEIVSVDPPEPAAGGGPVKVVVRVPY